MTRLEEHDLPVLPGWKWSLDMDGDWTATREADGVSVYTGENPSAGGLRTDGGYTSRPSVHAAVYAAVAVANGIDLCLPAARPGDKAAADRLRHILVAAQTANVEAAVLQIGRGGGDAVDAIFRASEALHELVDMLDRVIIATPPRSLYRRDLESTIDAIKNIERRLWTSEEAP